MYRNIDNGSELDYRANSEGYIDDVMQSAVWDVVFQKDEQTYKHEPQLNDLAEKQVLF